MTNWSEATLVKFVDRTAVGPPGLGGTREDFGVRSFLFRVKPFLFFFGVVDSTSLSIDLKPEIRYLLNYTKYKLSDKIMHKI